MVKSLIHQGVTSKGLHYWYGVFGPPNLPRPIVSRLNEDLQRVLADSEIRAKIDEAQFVIVGGSADQFVETIKNTTDIFPKWCAAPVSNPNSAIHKALPALESLLTSVVSPK